MYIQTWYCVPSNKRVRRLIRWLCLRLTGHEDSLTEYEVDMKEGVGRSYCRWCGKLIMVISSHPAKRHIDFMAKLNGVEVK